MKITITQVPVTSPEEYNIRKQPIVMKSVTPEKALKFLLNDANYDEFVYQIIDEDKNNVISVGEYIWEKDKKKIADACLELKKAKDNLSNVIRSTKPEP